MTQAYDVLQGGGRAGAVNHAGGVPVPADGHRLPDLVLHAAVPRHDRREYTLMLQYLDMTDVSTASCCSTST